MADLVQYLIHPALRPHLDAWLASRGLTTGRVPTDEGDLPMYAIVPSVDDGETPDRPVVMASGYIQCGRCGLHSLWFGDVSADCPSCGVPLQRAPWDPTVTLCRTEEHCPPLPDCLIVPLGRHGGPVLPADTCGIPEHGDLLERRTFMGVDIAGPHPYYGITFCLGCGMFWSTTSTHPEG
jgi:hypothetical protein